MSRYLDSAAARTLMGAAAVTLSLGFLAAPASAEGGAITRGALLGFATGIAADNLFYRHHYWRGGPVYEENTYVPVATPVYVPQPVYVPAATYGGTVERAFLSQDPALRQSIQADLNRDGFYHGRIDGAWGDATRSAILGYASSHQRLAMLTTVAGADHLFSQILS